MGTQQTNYYFERKNVIDQLLLLCRLKNPQLKTVKQIRLRSRNDVLKIQGFVYSVHHKVK